MAAKRQITRCHSKARSEDVRRSKQALRLLLGQLSQTLPVPESALRSALLLNFHRTAHPEGRPGGR